MLGKTVLAVVPARSGSKGIPNKNMRKVAGISLIGHAGQTLSQLEFIDAKVISTDSPEYAAEGKKYGLDAPFLRPPDLSSDQSGAVETMQHALVESEERYGKRFDVALIIEPTSPLRRPEDVEAAARLLIESGADSVVAVSPLNSKSHPRKLLTVKDDKLGFYLEGGNEIKGRQQLHGGLYWRNGVCYALTRECLMEKGAIITDNTLPYIINREIVNVDEPLELEWAEFLMQRGKK
ncbi:MAG TPA: acylneuraminate cytidylyltransferase family protein [Methanocella sp.]|nr:acylneuraminate cytidylyltransferase family protein [Methanocella sp.]